MYNSDMASILIRYTTEDGCYHEHTVEVAQHPIISVSSVTVDGRPVDSFEIVHDPNEGNPFEPPETNEQRMRRVGRMIKKNYDAKRD